MEVVIVLIIGVVTSFLGSILPGILNTSIVQIAMKDTKKNAHMFLYGALSVIFFQTYIALYFAQLIDQNASIARVINEIGLAIFVGLTVYFFSKKKSSKELKVELIEKTKRKHFFHGSLMALLNVFPILYYVFIGVTFSNLNLFDGHLLQRLVLSIGTVLGAYLAFQLYLYVFKRKKTDNHFFMEHINLILGTITLTVALVNAYKIFIK